MPQRCGATAASCRTLPRSGDRHGCGGHRGRQGMMAEDFSAGEVMAEGVCCSGPATRHGHAGSVATCWQEQEGSRN